MQKYMKYKLFHCSYYGSFVKWLNSPGKTQIFIKSELNQCKCSPTTERSEHKRMGVSSSFMFSQLYFPF